MRRIVGNQSRNFVLIDQPPPAHRRVHNLRRHPQRAVVSPLHPGHRQPRPVRRPGGPGPAFRQFQPLRPIGADRPAYFRRIPAAAGQPPPFRAIGIDDEQIPIGADISNAIYAHRINLNNRRDYCRDSSTGRTGWRPGSRGQSWRRNR